MVNRVMFGQAFIAKDMDLLKKKAAELDAPDKNLTIIPGLPIQISETKPSGTNPNQPAESYALLITGETKDEQDLVEILPQAKEARAAAKRANQAEQLNKKLRNNQAHRESKVKNIKLFKELEPKKNELLQKILHTATMLVPTSK